jgi:alpha-L-arabinofuranosidase
MLTRRQFAASTLAVPALLHAQPKALNAKIKIDPDRRISEIDPKIYGNFAEHLGRCIEGGIWEEGSPLSDSTGYRKDVMQAVKNLDVTLLRWPGASSKTIASARMSS